MNAIRNLVNRAANKVNNPTNKTVKYIGQDRLGNKYYEAHRPMKERNLTRYYEKPDLDLKTDHFADLAHVSPCWDAWLRFRRKEPPSQEEEEAAEQYFNNQQRMAEERKQRELEESKALAESQDKLQLPDYSAKILKPKREIPKDLSQTSLRQ